VTENLHEFRILEQIEKNPDATQADLAAQMGVAIGTVNWYVKRLIAKGFVKVTHLQRRRLRYLITPNGIAEKSRLTVEYMRVSLQLYRNIREQSLAALRQVRRAGHNQIVIQGDGDAADICRLTCVEQGVAVVTEQQTTPGTPTVVIDGARVTLGVEV
jgi:DNA-binding MarR family transcriptional regulator